MTSAQESEFMTRVGPGTPMGNLMREYWIPAAKSSELVADGEPVRLRLLGENLIAFRDTSGRVGIMDHRCPHRVASLFFGRNEEDGLRCVYHGWKFDVEGKCLDMPNVPKHQQFTEQVTAKAYKAVERAGMVWAYMGSRKVAPPLPAFEAALLPAEEVTLQFIQRECNWLQALEGDIDTSHLSFLHYGSLKPEDLPPGDPRLYTLTDRSPEYHISDTDWGTMYAAYRPADAGNTYWRAAHFLFPFWAMPPISELETHVMARGWVPLDDTHTMFIRMTWTGQFTARPGVVSGARVRGGGQAPEFLPHSTDFLGRFRPVPNRSNDYAMDRAAQAGNFSYTGIEGIHMQDQAVTESMGDITDHTFEHLTISDRMINRTRQRITEAARALQEGIVPPGVDNPEVYLGARGGNFVAPESVGWLEAYAGELRKAANPTGALKLAAE